MKKLKITNLILLLVTLILEISPYGAVLCFGNPDGEDWYRTYSYFSLIPFGYANFGPFITALLTCALLILTVIALFKDSKKINKTIFVLGCITVLISFAQGLYGYSNFIAFIISIILVVFTVNSYSVLENKK